ncbi:anhydro-N-acetylmuramic acid kinase [Rhodobacteraceae bacterium]|nr:anhydro-N-acetylmuramic acid kinase [Paracoccaceae bacterium]
MTTEGALWVLGAMSGTSLDGVDAAMVYTDGEQVFDFGQTGYRAYSDDERAVLQAALGREEGAEIDAAADVIVTAHAELLSGFDNVDLVGFHGQTTFHDPGKGRTCQIGDGAELARRLVCPVVWNFRSADVALGGQGAPLAPFYHFALAKRLGLSAPMAFLNIGGVANLTWLDPRKKNAADPGACLAFDTGPGNALIDDLCRARLGQPMDRDGKLTREGDVDDRALVAFLRDPFFLQAPPKSLDRDHFSAWSEMVDTLSNADAVATLAAGTVSAVALGIEHCPTLPEQLLVAGGGRNNPGLIAMLEGVLDCPVRAVEDFDLDGDMLEAQAFAYLAMRVHRGLSTSAPGTTGVAAPVGGGTLSEGAN